MSITLLPKWAGPSSTVFSMKVLETTAGQDMVRPHRGDPIVPPDKFYEGSAVKIVASAAALATLLTTMIWNEWNKAKQFESY